MNEEYWKIRIIDEEKIWKCSQCPERYHHFGVTFAVCEKTIERRIIKNMEIEDFTYNLGFPDWCPLEKEEE